MPPPAGLIPEHAFSVRCQYQRCGVQLGLFYAPCVGAIALYPCHRCGRATLVRSEEFSFKLYLLDRKGNELDKRTGAPCIPGHATAKTPVTPAGT
jgi:hypothetical protein